MIRNVVIHIANEQPLLADIYSLPQSTDAGLVCTNLRTPDGKRPVFIDDSAATFFFPYLHIRFVEIPVGALEAAGAALGAGEGSDAGPSSRNGTSHGAGSAGAAIAAAISAEHAARSAAAAGVPDDLDTGEDLEIDEDFLRRIREV